MLRKIKYTLGLIILVFLVLLYPVLLLSEKYLPTKYP